jgi:ABC-type multidrug transport system fused ATPase/permease subunit
VLSGLTPPTAGEVLIDGQPLDSAQLKLYRRRIGYVSQKPYIMAGTIAENVAFSQWGKPYDPEKVKDSCRKAAIDFLGEHCNHINKTVGEDGVGLSGGEAQRVSIARALYADPDIILFDEATSALDHVNERLIFKTIQDLRHSVTCIVVTHRLNTLEACDIVYWLEDGGVVASGTPQDILPRYRRHHKEVKA